MSKLEFGVSMFFVQFFKGNNLVGSNCIFAEVEISTNRKARLNNTNISRSIIDTYQSKLDFVASKFFVGTDQENNLERSNNPSDDFQNLDRKPKTGFFNKKILFSKFKLDFRFFPNALERS